MALAKNDKRRWMARGSVDAVSTLAGLVLLATVALVSPVLAQAPEARLTIGVLDGPEEYVFGYVRDLEVASAGNIYVLDTHASEVRVYDSEGNYRDRTRKGEGPGEFLGPRSMALDGRGRLHVTTRHGI